MADNSFDLPDDTEFSTGDPIKGSHPQRIKDSIIANVGLTAGVDGALTAIPSDGPTPKGAGITISATATMAKSLSVIHCKGDFTLQSTYTLSVPQVGTVNTALDPDADASRYLDDNLRILSGGNFESGAWAEGAGGGGYGNGGNGASGAAAGATGWGSTLASNAWRAMMHRIGGWSEYQQGTGTPGARGGGSLILFVEGDCTIAGTLEALGAAGTVVGSDEQGGGGGGSIVIICTGTIDGTGGTIDVSGGAGYSGFATGGGGGGYIGLVAPAITAPTYVVAGGAAGGAGGSAGANGLNEAITTFTASELRAFVRSCGVAA